MSKKYTVQTTCPYCKSPIIISYTKFKPFKNSGITDVRLEIEVGCKHIAPGPIDGYVDFGLQLRQMKENRRVDMQDLEDKEKQKRLKEILGDYDEDDEFNFNRF